MWNLAVDLPQFSWLSDALGVCIAVLDSVALHLGVNLDLSFLLISVRASLAKILPPC